MPNDYFVGPSGDPGVQDSISNFIRFLHFEKNVHLCQIFHNSDQGRRREYVPFEGDVNALIQEFLSRK